jgi:hypothetical protein
VSELCHIPPETLVKSITYRDVPKQIAVAEVVDRSVTCSGTRRNSTASTEIKADAFHRVEEHFDRVEMAGGARE